MSEKPPMLIESDPTVGLFVRVDASEAELLQEDLMGEHLPFAVDPPDAAHLAEPEKRVLVFGNAHPLALEAEIVDSGFDVVVDPRVRIPEDTFGPPVARLLTLGEPKHQSETDYAALGLSPENGPELIRMMTDEALHAGPGDGLVMWAPIHAWRALAQLRVKDALGPLLGMLRRIDDHNDDWVGEEVPEILARFGADALAPIVDHLADTSRGEWSRVAAARAIAAIGTGHPETRGDCVARLTAQLERFEAQTAALNGFLISYLLDLAATEAMPLIERAMASGHVDESIAGDLEDVQIELGLKTKRENPRKRFPLLPAAPLDEEDDPALDEPPAPYVAPPKIGRNEPCPCGSGKKYKKCCGR